MNQRHHRERGGSLVIVLMLTTALLGGAGITLYVQLADTRTVGLVRDARSAMYCAESGLVVARKIIANNFAMWPALLDGDPANDPTWYPVRGDVGDGGAPDFEVVIRDNHDEPPGTADVLSTDQDLQVYLVARCVAHPQAPAEVAELVNFSGSSVVYRAQAGGGLGNTGNFN